LILHDVNIKRIPRTKSKFLKTFSSIASFVFHPLIIVSYVAIVSYTARLWEEPIGENSPGWMVILVLATVICPFLLIIIFRLTGLISDAFMYSPRDRVLPLFGTLIFYCWAYYFFEEKLLSPVLLRILLLGAVFSILLDFFINWYYKVSVHTTAAAMMPGYFVVLLLVDSSTPILLVAFAVLAAILVGFVRWWLGAHTIGQILLGYATGISTQFLAWLILK
jgi:hypothetical protein